MAEPGLHRGYPLKGLARKTHQRPSLARGHPRSERTTGDAGDVTSLAMCDCRLGLATGETPMDQRIEAFLADVLALAGEDPEAIREGVRVALADCEEIFRAQETDKRMKDKAAHACRALCRARVTEELLRRRGTRIAEHLTLVLKAIDRQVH
jgi:hypothetical protein